MRTPRPYQEVAIVRALQGNLILADEQGLGKTLVACHAARGYHRAGHTKPILVVCPKSVRRQWRDFILDEWPDTRVDIVDSRTWLDPRTTRNTNRWIITNYESLARHEAFPQIYWGYIIADEAHRIRNRQADRTRALKKLTSDKRLALTGTPMDKHPAELWSLLNWLYPDTFRGYWAFFERHVNVERQTIRVGGQLRDFTKILPGAKDPTLLAKELLPYMLRRTKREVAPDLPERIEQVVTVDMHPTHAKLYNAIETADDLMVDMPEEFVSADLDPILIKNAMSKMVRLTQASTDPSLITAMSRQPRPSKLEWVVEYVEDNPDERFIVFTQFRDTADYLARTLEAVKVVGGTSRPDVSRATRIVATTAAAAEGLDLPHIRVAIFVDCVYSSIMMSQALDRIHRMNIDEPKQIIFLENDGTIDGLIRRASLEKWSRSALVYEYLRSMRDRQVQRGA